VLTCFTAAFVAPDADAASPKGDRSIPIAFDSVLNIRLPSFFRV